MKFCSFTGRFVSNFNHQIEEETSRKQEIRIEQSFPQQEIDGRNFVARKMKIFRKNVFFSRRTKRRKIRNQICELHGRTAAKIGKSSQRSAAAEFRQAERRKDSRKLFRDEKNREKFFVEFQFDENLQRNRLDAAAEKTNQCCESFLSDDQSADSKPESTNEQKFHRRAKTSR